MGKKRIVKTGETAGGKAPEAQAVSKKKTVETVGGCSFFASPRLKSWAIPRHTTTKPLQWFIFDVTNPCHNTESHNLSFAGDVAISGQGTRACGKKE